jgi:hypothetical protein
MIIKPSSKNTNKHTQVGMDLLETSIDKVGVIESISVTKEGTIISGHARSEIFEKKGMKPKEIKLESDEYPVIVTDIEDNSKQYFEAQILANTTANKNYNLDNELIEEIAIEYELEIEEIGVDVVEFESEPDYSILDDEDEYLQNQTEQMTAGVKKAIQIEFEAEHYDEASELVKFWREQKLYIGGFLMEKLKAEKEKL